jgi:hypothetical protein
LSRLVNKIVSEEIWIEYQYQHSRGFQLHMSEHVKNLLFQEISKALELAYSAKKEEVKEEDKKKKEEEKKKEGRVDT